MALSLPSLSLLLTLPLLPSLSPFIHVLQNNYPGLQRRSIGTIKLWHSTLQTLKGASPAPFFKKSHACRLWNERAHAFFLIPVHALRERCSASFSLPCSITKACIRSLDTLIKAKSHRQGEKAWCFSPQTHQTPVCCSRRASLNPTPPFMITKAKCNNLCP